MLDALSIRPVVQEDLPTLLEWRNHPSVRACMLTQHIITPTEHARWFDKVSQDPSRALCIVESPNGPMGYVQFDDVRPQGVSQWGFYLNPQAPKGSGSAFGAVALHHAFEKLQIHKVCGQVLDTNLASQAFHNKLGFQLEGTLRQHHALNGAFHGLVCYGLLASEWSSA